MELRKRGYIEEAVKGKNPYAALARMTNNNDHGGALLKGAELLGAKSIADRAVLVNKLHKLEGSLPQGLSEYRYDLHKELMEFAKKKLSPEEYDKFHGSF